MKDASKEMKSPDEVKVKDMRFWDDKEESNDDEEEGKDDSGGATEFPQWQQQADPSCSYGGRSSSHSSNARMGNTTNDGDVTNNDIDEDMEEDDEEDYDDKNIEIQKLRKELEDSYKDNHELDLKLRMEKTDSDREKRFLENAIVENQNNLETMEKRARSISEKLKVEILRSEQAKEKTELAEQQMKFSQKKVEEQHDYIARLEKELLENKLALKAANSSCQNAKQKAADLLNENLALKGQNVLAIHEPNVSYKRPRKAFENNLGSPIVEMEQDENTAMVE